MGSWTGSRVFDPAISTRLEFFFLFIDPLPSLFISLQRALFLRAAAKLALPASRAPPPPSVRSQARHNPLKDVCARLAGRRRRLHHSPSPLDLSSPSSSFPHSHSLAPPHSIIFPFAKANDTERFVFFSPSSHCQTRGARALVFITNNINNNVKILVVLRIYITVSHT